MSSRFFPLVCVLLLTLTAAPASAVDYTWVGDEAVKSWEFLAFNGGGFDTNWSPQNNLVPGISDTVTFDSTGLVKTVLFNSPQISSITFDSTSSYTLSGTNLFIASGDIDSLGGGGGADHTIASDILLGTAGEWRAVDDLIVNGVISGAHLITKTSLGTLTLTANNDHGGIRVEAGTLEINGAGRIGANGTDLTLVDGSVLRAAGTINAGANRELILDNGGVIDTNGNSVTWAGVVSGTGSLTKNGSGTLTLSGANTHGGTTTINAGSIQLGNALALQNSTVDIQVNGGLNVNSLNATLGALAGSGNLNFGATTLTVGNNNANTTYTGNLTGDAVSGVLKHIGTGTLTLSGGTSSSGQLNVASGGVSVTNGASLITTSTTFESSASSLTVDGATLATFTLGNTASTTPTISISDPVGSSALSIGGFGDADSTFDGVIQDASGGAGSLNKNGLGTLTLNGANTYSGGTNIFEGTLSLGNSNAAGTGTVTVLDGTIDYANSVNAANQVDLQNNATLNVTSGSATHSGVISETGGPFGITKTGSGTLALTAANTFTGSTTLDAGTLRLGDSAAAGAGSITVLSGTIDYAELVNVQNAIDLQNNATLNLSSSIATHSGVIGETGGPFAITKTGAGTLVLTAANTYTGGTTLSGGTLRLNNNAAAGTGTITVLGSAIDYADTVNISNTIDLQNDVTFNVSSGAAAQSSVIGETGGSFGVTKVGPGALTLSAANTYTGDTTISSGSLVLGAATTLQNSTVDIQVNGGLDINSLNATIGGLAGTGNLDLGSQTLTVGGNGSNTDYSGVLSGSGSFVKQGTSILQLSGTNTHSGGTSMNAGVLAAKADANFGDPNAPISFDGGTLLFDATFNLAASRLITINEGGGSFSTQGRTITVNSTLAGTGRLSKLGGGTLNLSGAGSSVGSVRALAGNLNIAADLTLTDSGTIIQASNNSNINITAPITATETNTNIRSVNNGDLTISGSATTVAATNLVVDTLATATLENQAAATFTGSVDVGSLNLFQLIAGDLTIQSGASLAGSATGNFIFGDFTVTGNASSAAFSELNIGANVSGQTTRFDDGANVTVSGNTLVFITDFSISGATFSTGTISDSPGGSSPLKITDPIGDVALTVGTNDGTSVYSSSIVDSVDGPGSLRKVGAGKLTLSAANTYSGGTILSAGTLRLNNDSAAGTGTITVEGGVLEYGSGRNIANPIDLQNNLTFNIPSGSATHSGVIGETDGSFGITKTGAGTLILTGEGSYGGQTTITEGTLLANNTSGVVNGFGNVTVSSGATLGGTGAIGGNVNVNSGGTLAPGASTGALTTTVVDLKSGSTLAVELAGSGGVAGTDFDQLVVQGTVTLNGLLDVSLVSPFVPSLGESFEIIDVGAIRFGNFDGLPQAALVGNFGGTDLFIDYASGDGNDVSLVATLAGDFDLDFDVDGADFLLWQTDPSIGALADWEANYGATIPITAAATAVPEPTTGALSLAVFSMWMVRRRSI